MNIAYINEIQNRVFAPVTDLKTICKDIPLEIYAPFEYTSNNGFYGIDMALKQYAGLPHSYHLKAHYSHRSFVFKGTTWEKDYEMLPMLFTWSPFHEKAYKTVSRKPAYSIGPTIHYAQNAYTEEKILSEKNRLGKNALVFPTHATHYVGTCFSIKKMLTYLDELRSEFDTIRVSIYWKDFLNGLHTSFEDAGYECVSAGHIFDPYFLPRLKALLSVADHTFGNAYGTNICCAIYMNTPFTYFSQEVTYDYGKDPTQVQNWSGLNAAKEMKDKFLENFSVFSSKISSLQYNLCNHYFGYDQVRTREELLTLLRASEDFFHALLQDSSLKAKK